MLAALFVATPSRLPETCTTLASIPSNTNTKSLGSLWNPRPCPCPPLKAAYDISTVDYSSITSVFPADACDLIGGEACDAHMFPEVKLNPETTSDWATTTTALELIDRDYLDCSDYRTVFLEEACDDLGGEFCEAAFQRGLLSNISSAELEMNISTIHRIKSTFRCFLPSFNLCMSTNYCCVFIKVI